ncbi:MAG: P-loop NTPase, partial [Spirochaetia bacterium]
MEAVTTDTEKTLGRNSRSGDQLMKRSIAITSGKGGVGKTSTAVNLALYLAGDGMRTALLDLDPLADVSSFLDMQAPESALTAETVSPDSPLDAYTMRAFSNLDVLFPGLKLSRGASGRLRSMLTETYRDELADRYDVLIFDLPAGNEEDINLAFVDLAGTILLVTNPEPTAHMSAGGWCRALFETRPNRTVYVWHNKFSAGGPDGFNPRTVIKNYNTNSSPELQIPDAQASQIIDLAWVPEDPALSMLE